MDDTSELERLIAAMSAEQKAELDVLLAPELTAALAKLPRNWLLRPYQKPAWDYLINGGKRCCLIWHRRCIVEGMRVVLSNGQWVPIEILQIGQEILSWDGEKLVSDRVTNVWFAGLKPVTEYRASGFEPIELTDDHRLYGFHPIWNRAGWLPVKELVRRRLAAGQFVRGFPGMVDAGDLAELLGYLFTDGYVSIDQQPKFTNINLRLIDRVAVLATALFGIVPKLRQKGNGFDLGLSNGRRGGGEVPNPLKAWFAAQGALAAKAYRRLPPAVWTWSDDTIWRFFGAVVDGDGSIYSQKRSAVIVDAKRGARTLRPAAQLAIHAGLSRGLAEDYLALLRKVGIVAGLTCQRGSNWVVRFTRQDSISKFLSSIRTVSKEPARLQALQLCSDRRERQTKYGCEKGLLVAGASRVAKTWDIETERHHCFFANGYLVHNSGKDDIALNFAAVAAHQRTGEYWHMLPEASQARKAIWDAVSPHTGVRRIDQAFPRDLREKTREDEMVIRFKCGSLWRVVGSDNYESLIGSTPVGIVFSEWALADPNAWAFLRPILMENGGWAMFITTPRGSNHARRTLDLARKDPDWFAQVLSVAETGVFTPAQLAIEKREYVHEYGEDEGAALFEQEYNCSFEAALIGSFYGSYLNRARERIGRIQIDRALPVHTSWDLGISDSTAIWFIQVIGKEYRLVDYHEAAGVGLDEYARVLRAKQEQHGWIYGKHYFPHDITVRELGNQGLSREDTLKGLGVKVTVVPQHSVMDGINAVRRLLDMAWIDEARCERGLNCLRNYRRVWDDKLKMFRDGPLHDWASHGADALRTFAAGHSPLKAKTKTGEPWIPEITLPHERGTGWMGN